MTPAPRTLPAEASAYDAALLIAQHGIRHVPVVDGRRLIGVVSERDLFALQRVGIRSIRRDIAGAAGLEELKQAARDIRTLARDLAGAGTAAEPLALIVSTLNDALTRRLIELEQARHELAASSGAGWLRQRGPLRADDQHRPGQRADLRARSGRDRRRIARAAAALRAGREPHAGRLRLPVVRGRHHGRQPGVVPEYRRMACPLRFVDRGYRSPGAAQLRDLLRFPPAARPRGPYGAAARAAAGARRGDAAIPAPDGRAGGCHAAAAGDARAIS